jgi:hypothetical protein
MIYNISALLLGAGRLQASAFPLKEEGEVIETCVAIWKLSTKVTLFSVQKLTASGHP